MIHERESNQQEDVDILTERNFHELEAEIIKRNHAHKNQGKRKNRHSYLSVKIDCYKGQDSPVVKKWIS